MAMITPAAEINPLITGLERKEVRLPSFNREKEICINPARKEEKITKLRYSGLPGSAKAETPPSTIIDIRATGPIER